MRFLLSRMVVGSVCAVLMGVSASASAAEQPAPIPNPEFRQGSDGPAGWTLSGGKGHWVDRDMLEVTGQGSDSNYWRCDYRFTPGALYHFRVRGRGTPTDGCGIVGPEFANRDLRTPSQDWTWFGYVFRVPDGVTDSYLRLGQWQTNAPIQFDAVRLTPAMAAHKAVGKILLGEGESIRDGRYTFSGTYDHEGSNYHRTLLGTTAGFNSGRWNFGGESQVTYRFDVPGHKLLSGKLSFNVNYHLRGGCAAEVSRDQKKWEVLATQEKVGTVDVALPDGLLPAETIFVRLRTATRESSFQVNRVELTAKLDGTPPDAVGETAFVDIEGTLSNLVFERFVLTEGRRSGKALRITVRNRSEQYHVLAKLRSDPVGGSGGTIYIGERLDVLPGKSATQDVPLVDFQSGENRLSLLMEEVLVSDPRISKNSDSQRSAGRPGRTAKVSLTYQVPEFYRGDYGQMLECESDRAALWWCPSAHKIPRQRGLPAENPGGSSAAQLSAARNDREAVQIVVRPLKDVNLKGLTAAPGAFSGPGGATIPAKNVQILRVAYHFVDHPTDKTGVRDFWPDALPPLKEPIDVPAGENQPLWVLVYVPQDAKPGDYSGKVALKAEGFSADVPLKLHVWDFALPRRNHIETAFGFTPGYVFRYHGLKTEEDRRRVLDMYFRCFAEHRISPYNPTPMDPIRVSFRPEADPPDARVDFSAFDRAMDRAVKQFNFTGIRLPIQGWAAAPSIPAPSRGSADSVKTRRSTRRCSPAMSNSSRSTFARRAG